MPISQTSEQMPTARCLVETRLPTDYGHFRMRLYENTHDRKDHIALVVGDVKAAAERGEPILVRMHSECLTGDVFGSRRCDCGEQLHVGMRRVSSHGLGVVLLLRQEGRGIGLLDKLRAYNLQDDGSDTVDSNLKLGHAADERDYTAAALILQELGIKHVQLLTNNPSKVESLLRLGLESVSRVPLEPLAIYRDNYTYLMTKVERMNHSISSLRHFQADETDNRLDSQDEIRLSVLRQANGSPSPQTRPAGGIDKPNGSLHKNGSAMMTPPSTEEDSGSEEDFQEDHKAATNHVLNMNMKQFAPKPKSTRPFVTMTYAQCLDGTIASRQGTSLAISGPASLLLTHRLRAMHDAILVGVGTILSDNPRLNARLPPSLIIQASSSPVPVILDAHLRTPVAARVISAGKPPIIFCLEDAPADKRKALLDVGCIVKSLPAIEGTDSTRSTFGWTDLLSALHEMQIKSVMVEGGATVLRSLAEQGPALVDKVVITISPQFANGLTIANMPKLSLHRCTTLQLGPDVIIAGTPLKN